jgi:transposase
MLLQTILNHVAPQKSFTYGAISWADDSDCLALEIRIEPRRANRPICSGCHRKGPGHARLG